ncbi:hypothetical protein JCM11641_004681 [Rhodosporidiobolus odoratus]
MSFAKVYGFEGNPRTLAALVVAKYEGLEVESVNVNPFAEGGVSADYLQKFPLGLVPALEKGDYKLTEAIAIAQYLAAQENKAGLLGSTKEEVVEVTKWASWANSDLLPAIGAWFKPLTGASPYQKPAVEAAKARALKNLSYLEEVLSTRTFLVGERVTLADIFVAASLLRGFENVLDAEFRKANVNTVRHFQTVVHQDPFVAAFGKEPTLIETAIVYTPPKKEAKPAKEAAAPKPKAEKPKKEEEEEEEPSAPVEAKPKHPCEALPKAAWPLDELKRQYSNKETPEALKWLDENWNPNDYSVWKATFKYPEELTQVFMSSNLITGFHTRLEGSRKYIFGSMGVYGKANDSLITGVYIIRGQDAEACFSVAPDWESYSFDRLDYNADKEFITGALTWEHTVDGKEYADGKVFK